MVSSVSPLSDVDLRQLRIFRAVVDHNGFTAAQDELGLSRSTISAQMAALETRLGLKLCRRGRSGFSLTEQGQKIYAEAIKCFAALENFRNEVGVMRGGLVGELRIGAVDVLAENPKCHLPDAIALFNERVPDVNVTIMVLSPNQLSTALLNKQIEVAIVANQPLNAALQLEQLFYEEQNLYCGTRHELFAAQSGELSLDRISKLTYARRGYTIATAYNSVFAHPPRATAYSMEGLAHLILSGRYVSFLPTHYAAQWVERGEMRALRPDLVSFQIGMCIAHYPVSTLSRVAEIFRSCLLEVH
ncbi:LysR family transcriptional regulator [Roseibium aggregatum]|uniref:LysR family transcriptional regulator n=1 Tax=Roseibium aggregatum TaxID=187304 RepID=A0A939EFA8_9HYPH|nr:LysR family transcriptional regulator [Roseibium aggregatum]MBN9670509.1 LysR family transcriptional regulator [Roseibium aggregatum]